MRSPTMRSLLALSLLATMAPAALAQTSLYTPAIGTAKEGDSASFGFGWSRDHVFRLVDASHVGKSVSIKRISFRLDGKTQNALARSWTQMTIHVAHVDWSSILVNKSNGFKLKDARTKVFDQKWSFPAFKGKPLLSPASWGGVQSSLSFSFSKPWVYNGKDAIFIEFTFKGGTSPSTIKWEPQWVPPKEFMYMLDTQSQEAWSGVTKPITYFPPIKSKTGKPCYDSDFPKSPVRLDLRVDAQATLGIHVLTQYTSKSSPVLHLIGVRGNPKGLAIGAGCHYLYMDPTVPMAILAQPAPNNGFGLATSSLQTPRQTWMSEIWVQGAWLESKTKTLMLTQAARFTFKTQSKGTPAAASLQDPKAKGGFLVFTDAPKYLPFIRYDL